MTKLLACVFSLLIAASAGATTEYLVTCDVDDTVAAPLCDYDIGPTKINVNSWGVAQRLWVTGDDAGAGRSASGLQVDMSMSGTGMVGLTGVDSEPLSTGVGTTHGSVVSVRAVPRAYGNHTLGYMKGLQVQLVGSSAAAITEGIGIDVWAPSLLGGSTIGTLAALSVRPDAGLSYFNWTTPSGGAGILNLAPSPGQLENTGVYMTGISNAPYSYVYGDLFYRDSTGGENNFAKDASTIANTTGSIGEYTSFWSKPSVSGAGSVDYIRSFRTSGFLSGKTYTKYYGLDLTRPTGATDPTKNYGIVSNFYAHGLGTYTPAAMLNVRRGAGYTTSDTVLVDGDMPTEANVVGIRVASGSSQTTGTNGTVVGVGSAPRVAGSGGSLATVVGVAGQPAVIAGNTTNITAAYGGLFSAYVNLEAENGTVVTNGYGLYVEAPGPNGTVTNKYGLIVESGAGFSGVGDTAPQATLSVGGHLQFDSTAPAVSSCGEGASIVGTDNAHRIIVGTGTITACTVTFAEEWTNTPICLVQDSDGTAVRVSSASATVITISGADFNSDTLVVHCLGYE